MTTEQLLNLIQYVPSVFTLIVFVLGYLKTVPALRQNQLIKQAFTIVTAIEQQFSGNPGDKKRELAIQKLTYYAKRVLNINISERTAADFIEASVHKMKAGE